MYSEDKTVVIFDFFLYPNKFECTNIQFSINLTYIKYVCLICMLAVGVEKQCR